MMSMMNPRLYTIQELLKTIVVLEIHFKDLKTMEQSFCMDCITKHLYMIWGYADEGVGFFPENPEPWRKIGAWADKVLRMGTLTGDQGEVLAEELRQLRIVDFFPIATAELKTPEGGGVPHDVISLEPPVLPEATFKVIVEAGGGTYVGVQPSYKKGLPHGVSFNDAQKLTGGTSTISVTELTPEAVRQKIADMRKTMPMTQPIPA